MKPLACLIAITILAGCATTQEFPPPNDLWESFAGQLQYTSPGHSVIGEFTAARHGDDFRLEFTKGSAFPLLKLAQHGEFARADGPLARGHWEGRADSAPAFLRGWMGVPRAFASLEKNPRIPRTGIRPEIVVDRGRSKVLSFPGANPGEKFTFHFTR